MDIEGLLRDSALSPEKAEEVMKNFGCFVSCTFEKSNIVSVPRCETRVT